MEESLFKTIEHDIADLERILQEKKAALEQEKSGGSGVHRSEKEMLHEAVGEKIREHVPSYQSSPVAVSPVPTETEPPSYLSEELKDKVRSIITLIFSKNMESGIKEAVKTGNPALVDALHDILTDELYEKMIVSGKLEKIE